MNLNYKNYYVFDRDFNTIKKDEDYLFVDYENVNWIRSNSTGKEIINLCDGKLSLEEVINKIAEDNAFDSDFLKSNFEHFLNEAINKGLIVEPGKEKKFIKQAFPEYPGDVWVHVTDKCNLNCPFCYSSSGISGKQELDYKTVLKFLEQIPKEHRKSLLISGGEPFLYKDLPQLTAGVHELEFSNIVVITNGTLGEEMYKDVLPNIHVLQISVDGTKSEIHDLSRGKGSFDKVIEKFSLAKSIGINKLLISFTPTKLNILDLPNIPKFAIQNNIDSIHITRLLPVGRGSITKDDITPDEDQYNESIGSFIKNMQNVNMKIHYKRETEEFFLDENNKTKYISLSMGADQSKKVSFRNKRINCSLGCGTLSINYNGNFYPCPSLHVDSYKMGHISDSKLVDILKDSHKMSKGLSVNNVESCKECNLKYFCGGGCRAVALAHSGSALGYDPLCEYYKGSIIDSMWKYRAQVSEN